MRVLKELTRSELIIQVINHDGCAPVSSSLPMLLIICPVTNLIVDSRARRYGHRV